MLLFTALFAVSYLQLPVQATWINVSYSVICQRVDKPFKYKVILLELDAASANDVLSESEWKKVDGGYKSRGWIRGFESGDWPTYEYEVGLRFETDCGELTLGDTHKYTVQFEICPKLAKQCNYHDSQTFDIIRSDRSTIFDPVYEKIYGGRNIVW